MKYSDTRRILFLITGIFLMIFPIALHSQVDPAEKENSDAVVVLLSPGTDVNIYQLNLKALPGFFEKAFLLDLLFKDSRLLIDQSNISGNTLEVRSPLEYDRNEVYLQLERTFLRALEAGVSTSPAEKEELLKKYEKFR